MFTKIETQKNWSLPFFPIGKKIPKLIHQTYYSKNLPPEFSENVYDLKERNPTWKYNLYDDEDIRTIVTEIYGSNITSYINKISPKYGAAKADLFRYLLLYRFGGVYLDIKSNCSKPLDDVIKPHDSFLLAHWKNEPGQQHAGFGKQKELSHIPNGEYQQWHIFTAAGHPFLKATIETVLTNIDNYNPWLHGTGGRGVLKLTGPIAYTLAIHPLISIHKHRVIDPDEVGLKYNALNKSHKRIFKSHYLNQTDSIIKFDGYRKISGQIYSLLRQAKRKLNKS